MAILPIIEAPDPFLRQVSAPVTAFDDGLRALIADMFETMYAAPGIGLAAVQVGVPQRLIVMDLQEPDAEGEAEVCGEEDCERDHRPARPDPRVFINPRLIDPSEDQVTYREGCLSVPDFYAEVDRPATVRLAWQDEYGALHEEAMEGLMATCIQHEMDHLEGVLFIDHLSRLKRNMVLKKLEKSKKAA